MENETKKLAALLQLALQKKTFIVIQPAEITHALSALHAASELALLFNPQPTHLVCKLQEALNVVTGVLFLLDNDIMPFHGARRKTISQQANQLHKSLRNYLHQYCSIDTESDVYPVKELVSLLSGINNTLKNNTAFTGLYSIVQPHLEKIIETKAFSFQRWLWWCRFASLYNTSIHDADRAEEFLVNLNFNTPAFINFLSQNLLNQLAFVFTMQAKYHLLAEQLLKYKSTNNLCTGYLSAENSVKQRMISFLQLQLRLLAARFSEQPTPEKQLPKLNTVLSVPQLALLIRLMIETKILDEKNQSALLKNIAPFVATSKAASVSAESLRVNYYTPGLAAKNIIKEYLSQMLRLINSY